MPWESKKQQRWGHSPAGKEALTDKEIKEFDDATNFDSIPEEATATEIKKPKKYDPIKTMKKVSRDSDPHKGKRRGGFHSTPKGKKGYTRKEKHPGQSDDSSEALTPEDETYRELMFPIASVLSWDIPAEGRPCGEGEDPKRGKCNPNVGPGMPYGPDEYRNDPDEWSREIDKYQDDAARIERRYQEERGPVPQPPVTMPPESPQRMDLRDLEDERRQLMMSPDMKHPQDRADYMEFYEREKKRIQSPGYDGGTPVKDTPGWPPTKDPNRGMPWGASMADIVAKLNWSTHKSETFDDTGEKGLHPAWGLKSIIDRGVQPHEKPDADKRIGEAENQTTQRDIPSEKFKSYSMVNSFGWKTVGGLPFPGAAKPFGSKDDADDDTEESDE